MSSHHIVREDQEPALLMIDADAIAFEKIQQLLEWSPTIMVAGQALEKVASWGIKIDVILTHPAERASLSFFVDEQNSVQWVDSTHSALEDGLNYFLSTKQQNVNLVMLATDHLFFMVEQWAQRLSLSIFDRDMRWSLIAKGKFEKWFPNGSVYQVREGDQSLRKVVTQDGIVTLERSHLFWVGEEW